MRNKITFVVIGPGKAGTTWMYNLLRHHPQVCMSSSKETLYFERYHYKSADWYHQFFSSCVTGRTMGEISNTYIFDKAVPQRIYDYNPAAKIISTLRNPVERTFSHYLYMLKVGEESGTFEDVLDKRPDLIYRGRYSSLLVPYFELFPRENILILLYEDLKSDAFKYSQTLLSFLNVNVEVPPDIVEQRVLEAGQARSPLLSKTVTNLANVSRDLGLATLVTQVKSNPVVSSFLYKGFEKGAKPLIKADTRKRLEELFYDDVVELSEQLGMDMVEYWNIETNESQLNY